MKVKNKILILLAIFVMLLSGVAVSLIFYSTQKHMDEIVEAVNTLKQEVETANEKTEKASASLEKTEERLSEDEKEDKKYKKKVTKLQEEQTEKVEEPTVTETSIPTPVPTVVATPIPSYPVQGTYYIGSPGYSSLVITGPDANGVYICNVRVVGNKGNDCYMFSGLLDVENGVIPFSNCVKTWESNGTDGSTIERYNNGCGTLTYMGNNEWKLDNYLEKYDTGLIFSYSHE